MKNYNHIIRGLPMIGILLISMTGIVQAQVLTASVKPAEEIAAPFIVNEQMPRLIGGMEALSRQIRYPKMAELAQMHGSVTIEFTVDEQGNVTGARPLKPAKWIGMDVLEAIETLTFEPARQNGRPVPVKMHLPLRFIIAGLTD